MARKYKIHITGQEHTCATEKEAHEKIKKLLDAGIWWFKCETEESKDGN